MTPARRLSRGHSIDKLLAVLSSWLTLKAQTGQAWLVVVRVLRSTAVGACRNSLGPVWRLGDGGHTAEPMLLNGPVSRVFAVGARLLTFRGGEFVRYLLSVPTRCWTVSGQLSRNVVTQIMAPDSVCRSLLTGPAQYRQLGWFIRPPVKGYLQVRLQLEGRGSHVLRLCRLVLTW